MSNHHSIAILGAGLSGLVLARILHVHGVTAAVFDRDATPSAAPRGGMLDIHDDSGQVALREAGLYDAFTALIHAGGEAMRVVDKHGVVRLAEAGEGGRPEVNRGALRDLLLSSLPPEAVRWGAKATSARALPDGRHEVTFANGERITCDLLVGADGAWSKVRALVSTAAPIYAGLSFIEVNLHDADRRHADAAAMVGSGMLFALSDGKGVLVHREPGDLLHGYIALQVPAAWSQGFDVSDAQAAKDAVAAHFTDWNDTLKRLITDADGPVVARPIYALPVGHTWGRTPGVTLVGDAAHLMSPFAGEGANLALQDGAELALALLANPNDREAAMAKYEESMFPRGAEKAAASAMSLEMLFRPDGPQGMLDLMAQYGAVHDTGADAAAQA